jgi:hypothetical protein
VTLAQALGDRHRVLLVQAQQHLWRFVAQVVDEAVMEAAIAGARIERDERDAKVAQRLGDRVAAEQGVARGGRCVG